MIPARPIRNVLAAVDLLTAPEDFVRNAAAFAGAIGADIKFVHSHHDGGSAGIRSRDWLEIQKELHQKRIALRNLLEHALPTGSSAESARVCLGSPDEAILTDAGDCQADLIVLGPHRHRQIGDRYMGGTAERVLMQASVPCLVLGSAMPWPIRRVLIPADFSAPSRSALRCGIGWVRALSDRGPVEINFVHVTGTTAKPDEMSRSAVERKVELEREVRSITGEAAVNVPVQVHVLEAGEPIEALTRFANDRRMDLVIMGTRGNHVFVRALLGSISSGMLRSSSLPMLLVPPPAFAEPRPGELRSIRGLEPELFPS